MSTGGLFNQQPTPLGGGQSPLSTGGEMSGGFGGGQQPQPLQNQFGDTQYRPFQYGGYTNAFNQSFGSPMGQFSRQLGIQPMSQEQFAQNAATAQNSLGGQQAMQPAYMQDPEFQGYQTQVQDLNRQMQDYIQKAPMYQQLQDLQGKMRGISSRFAQQRQQSMQQYNPYVRQMPQQYSNQGLAGLYAAFPQNFGRQQTYSTPRMAQIPQNFGREQTYANPSTYADYSSLRAPPAAAATAPASAAAVIDAGYYGYGTPFRKGGKV